MPVPAIVIGAISAAASIAATEGASALSAKLVGSKHVQGGTVDNEADLTLTLMRQGQPNHGLWAVPAGQEIASEPTAQTLFNAWKQTPDAPENAKAITSVDQLPDELAQLLANWIESNVRFAASTGTFGLKSHGAGVEGTVVYGDVSKNVAIVFYLATPDIGQVHAGSMIKTYTTMQELINNDDEKLNDIRKTIRDSSDSDTEEQFSSGESMSVALGNYKVEFAAAEETTFKVSGSSAST